MNESQFEDIVTKYPNLIEDGLSLMGRQVRINGKYIDILFKDRLGQKLIVELKKGSILRKHIGQLLDYEGFLLSPDDPTIRVMLVGNRVPNNLRRALDHHGFEWKELQVINLKKFLIEKEDRDLLEIFKNQNIENKLPLKIENNDRMKTEAHTHETSSNRPENQQEAAIQFRQEHRERKMGHRSGDCLFGTKAGTMANHFCHAIIASGSLGISMYEARNAHWNPKGYHFKETVSRLIKEGLVTFENGRYYATNKGLMEA